MVKATRSAAAAPTLASQPAVTLTAVLVRNPERRQWLAFGWALGLESALIGVLMAWLATHLPEPTENAVPLSIEALVAPALEKPLEPEKIKPPPVLPLAKPLAKPLVKAVTPTPPAPLPTPVVAAAIAPPLTSAPSPIAAVAPAAAAPAVPVAPPVTGNVVDPALAYNAKLTAAAQAAFEVPGAVTALAFKGRARVEFNLRDAVASSIHIVQSSGLGAMDRAALKAVQNAAFPQPPASLQGKEMRYQIWVTHDTHL
jgi:protein TonB